MGGGGGEGGQRGTKRGEGREEGGGGRRWGQYVDEALGFVGPRPRQAFRQTHRQAGRQTDRQTDRTGKFALAELYNDTCDRAVSMLLPWHFARAAKAPKKEKNQCQHGG